MPDRVKITMRATKRIKTAATQSSNETNSKLLDLTDFILTDIISRLPIASIFACRCVCKRFLRLISDDFFPKLHLAKPPFTSIVFTHNLGYQLVELGKNYHYTYKINLPRNDWKLVSSCNGLLCMLGIYPLGCHLNFGVHISNPVQGEYVTLALSTPNYVHISEFCGFGFSAASGHYKILILESVCIDKNKSRAKVLTFGTSTWRDVGHAPYPLNGQFPSAALNGALHWLVDDDDASSAVLYAFDIDKEVTYQIPSPPNLGKCTKRMSLEVIQNFLCIFHDTHLVHFDTWSMKDYGVETSWTLDRILRSSVPDTLRYEELDPITLWKDCEILMRCGSADLISYNQKERIIAVCEMHNAFMMLKVKSHAAHALNLSSLKKITMGEWLKIKKFTGYTNLMRHGSLISYNHNKGSFTRFEIHNKNLWYGVKAHPTYALNFSSLKTIAMGESLMIKKLTNYSNVMKCSGDDAFFPDVEGPVRD